ncbi:1,2-phenylacetyl-CoA epoxidase subunit PaaD [Roseisolibacter sp. H3M3-2]|uniref:1,2-phenylacetyl-CoA epoxidase subunit PaaD n=1 Tax=Roseisolibacter sp. H3M3-2 TaxID=3031323 RepID=UPI0023DC0A72|nr:1,2-phenylacetyl-CoA epoxidase subunit PaaD [Roseisolibacter sp. H3M3-2]MDF1502037.1 phenylacetate-CoA oxygenase subunit PaaJ [Roseisolibacter sp. H3M3-2]
MVDRRAPADPGALARALGDGWELEPAPDASPAAPIEPQPLTAANVWAALETVPDPEVPVISVVELGIVRDVEIDGDALTVVITPTYSGCPAMREIERDVLAALHARGWADARLRTVFAPAWTTEWMSDAARAKLRAYGIAPPRAGGASAGLVTLRRRGAAPEPVPCPFCGSHATRLQSAFGSTACKALHTCDDCRQPFEEFKPI